MVMIDKPISCTIEACYFVFTHPYNNTHSIEFPDYIVELTRSQWKLATVCAGKQHNGQRQSAAPLSTLESFRATIRDEQRLLVRSNELFISSIIPCWLLFIFRKKNKVVAYSWFNDKSWWGSWFYTRGKTVFIKINDFIFIKIK